MSKPNQRQINAMQNMADNGGNMRQALLAAGYSQSVADTPKKFYGSKSVEQLLAVKKGTA
jgi:hypothetical protein